MSLSGLLICLTFVFELSLVDFIIPARENLNYALIISFKHYSKFKQMKKIKHYKGLLFYLKLHILILFRICLDLKRNTYQ